MNRTKIWKCGRVERLTRFKIFISNNWMFIIEIIITVLLCVVHALGEGHYVNFYPINGTFQNYNPVRRLVAGQVPYRDFQDYLGLGHLYMGSLATILFGSSYRSSLMAFSFLTLSGLAAISYMVSLALFKKKEKSAAITNIILVILLIQPLILTNAVVGTQEILNALISALGTGNSARFVRGLILPIVVFLIWLGYLAYMKIARRHERILNYKDLAISIGIGFIAGFAFVWSNDYGISCWVCLFIMTLWVSICRSRKFIRSLLYAGVELIVSFVGVFVTVEIFTAGHFSGWFSATFGAGGYQGWYYNSSKSYYLYDVDFSYIMLIQAGITIVYLIKLFVKYQYGEELRRYGILAFANMVCFCAVNEYRMLSGGGIREISLSVLFFTVLYEFIRLYDNHQEDKFKGQVIIVASVIVCLSWIISQLKDEFIFKFMTDKDGIYVDALGGNLLIGDELLMTAEFLGGENFFATYASAQEVVNGSFQPSGTDYIIHVLGDQQRKDYLNSFNEDDFKYAATIKETFTLWEYWVQRANWFFYRELYENWHPVYANTYEVFWQRNASNDENIITDGYDIEIENVNEYSKKIIIRCSDEINGVADVYIDAIVNLKGGLSSKIVFNKMIRVQNTGTIYAQDDVYFESNYLRPEAKEYIPIPIINGYGEVLLTSEPQRNTMLILNSVSCERILTVTSDFVQVTGTGVDDNGRVIFYVENTDKNKNALVNLQYIEFLGEQYSISEISEEDASLCIIVDEIMDAPIVEVGRENYLLLRR